jgi:uncharacterized membrane protein YbaN (DUF454 family)
MRMGSLRRALLLACGLVAVGLATAGVFLPVLPTTPFLLLAAACFARSSDRFHRWLLTHKLFGRHIRLYQRHRAITKSSRISTLVVLWLGISASGLLVDSLAIRLLLLLVALSVTAHLLTLRSATEEMLAEDSHADEIEDSGS